MAIETAASTCGTRPGYVGHRRRGEDVCGPCNAANNKYTNARRRALTKLAQRYAGEYAALFAAELAEGVSA